MQARPIRFYHRARIVEVRDAAPTRTLLDWLREDAACHGTKEGCNEGDCGACTVVVAELAAPGDASPVGGLRLESVNACLQFLPTLDGKAVFSVEDLSVITGGALHPVQQALVDCHGSQCGFCTPGFAMSLWESYEHAQADGSRPDRGRLADALSGNLCRCTGYRPILDAGERMFDLPPARLDTLPVRAALERLRDDPPLVYLPQADGPCFHAPRTLDALAALRVQFPNARVLAGATDIALWVNKQFRSLGDIIYVGAVAELRHIAEQPGPHGPALHIGAGASLEQAWDALTLRHPTLREVWMRFASPPVRHAGTMGGNVANGSPIGDAAPILMSLDAELELRRGSERRRIPLASFYLGYMKNDLQPGEFIQSIVVPSPGPARQVRAYKVSKRHDCDISALCAGLSIELEAGRVRTVRLAFGGMAATVQRARGAEAALLGQPWDAEHVTLAQTALAADFTPLSDVRASADYRTRVAQNLLKRFWYETRSESPLPALATQVWAIHPVDVGGSAAQEVST